MTVSRRNFSLLVAALGAVAVLPACSLKNLYGQIGRYIPLVLLAFDRILEILAEHGITLTPDSSTYVNAVKAALADILAAIAAHRHALENKKATAIEALRAALSIAQARLDEFWLKLALPATALATTIKLLLTIIVSTLAGYEERLPGVVAVAHPPTGLTSVAKARSIEEFRRDFNQVLQARGESPFVI